jgi:sugar phosphate isomerase/epimerase
VHLASFTDEINRDDPARAVDLAVRWGIGAVEIRQLPGGRVPRVDDAVLAEEGRRIRDAGLVVSGFSPGLCKSPVDAEQVEADITEILPRTCEWARHWDCNRISVFGFGRGDAPHGSGAFPQSVVDALGRMADVAAATGCRLSLENEAACWGDTGTEAAALVRAVGHDALRLCWDPGNAARAGVAAPFEEYAALADLVDHVHLKNFDPAVDGWSRMDVGVVDWPAQMAALQADGFDGWLVLETHMHQLPAGTQPLTDAGEALTALESNALHNLRVARRLLADVPG